MENKDIYLTELYVRATKDFGSFLNESNQLPLDSLYWEFWNQSRVKIHSKADEFAKHLGIYKLDIENAAKDGNETIESIEHKLKNVWNESRSSKGDNSDMHKERERFKNFTNNLK